MQNSIDEGPRIPFGEWFGELVTWCDNNLKGVLEAIEWPFNLVLDLVGTDGYDLSTTPRLLPIIVLALLGYLSGGLRRAAYVGGSVGVLALMGDAMWGWSLSTMYTLLIVFVAVALITIPVTALLAELDAGEFSERSGVARGVDRVLTGSLWIHPYALMLPIIYFFGIGRTSAAILLVICLLPGAIAAALATPGSFSHHPVRQLAHRVRIGLRASVPLALLLVGVFAIIAVDGLGTSLFRAVNNQDLTLMGDAAVAMWFVGLAFWSLLGPWSFGHLPGMKSGRERQQEIAPEHPAAPLPDEQLDSPVPV